MSRPSTTLHLGVYSRSGTMPACNEKKMPYDFTATDDWTKVTCKRCLKSDAYACRFTRKATA